MERPGGKRYSTTHKAWPCVVARRLPPLREAKHDGASGVSSLWLRNRSASVPHRVQGKSQCSGRRPWLTWNLRNRRYQANFQGWDNSVITRVGTRLARAHGLGVSVIALHRGWPRGGSQSTCWFDTNNTAGPAPAKAFGSGLTAAWARRQDWERGKSDSSPLIQDIASAAGDP